MKHWRQSALWLAFLAPFFYLTYGLSNALAAQRAQVPTFAFDWERHVPFLAWTIFPYWSINAFYGLSLFLCRSPHELGRHARRLLTAQIVAVTCFLLWPLKLGVTRPAVDGAAGWLFDALSSFDQPFNQAPSLHIALLVILWDLYRRLLPRWAMPILHGWSLLIGVSVLTTYQHHFIDIPTGAALGLVCLWLFPFETHAPRPTPAWTRDPRRRAIGAAYALGAVILLVLTLAAPKFLWPLGWPALALAIVAANYLFFGAAGFRKSADGRTSLAIRWLLAPYHLAAWLNSRAWTHGQSPAIRIADGVWLGRWPNRIERAQHGSIVSLAPEMVCGRGSRGVPAGSPPPQPSPASRERELDEGSAAFSPASAPAGEGWGGGRAAKSANTEARVAHQAFPCLDLIPIDTPALAQLADTIESARTRHPPVLVCCALGYGRSAAAVMAWLIRTGRASSVDSALARLRAVRPGVVLSDRQRDALAALVPAT